MPSSALAFSINGYLVWNIISNTNAQVVDTSLARAYWSQSSSIAVGASSLTDGNGNTTKIVNTLGTSNTYAALSCNRSTNDGASTGSWYLPAICELGPSGTSGFDANCPAGITNLFKNLWHYGFIDSSSTAWSSTESTDGFHDAAGFCMGSI